MKSTYIPSGEFRYPAALFETTYDPHTVTKVKDIFLATAPKIDFLQYTLKDAKAEFYVITKEVQLFTSKFNNMENLFLVITHPALQGTFNIMKIDIQMHSVYCFLEIARQ